MDLGSHYWIINAHIPICLLSTSLELAQQITKEGLVACDLEIQAGKIKAIYSCNQGSETRNYLQPSIPQWDVKKGIILPCFVDMHTHLDKGHIWERSPNPDGTFNSALVAAEGDRPSLDQDNYQDIYRRMEFSLKSSYAQGTRAIRTHIDCPKDRYQLSLQVFKDIQSAWSDRLILQPVSLVILDEYTGRKGEILADRIAEVGGILGGVPYSNPNLDQELDRLFNLATERNLDLDLHTDENDDPSSQTLRAVAKAALRHNFTGKITCGHCCSLAVQSQEDVDETMGLLKLANISIVSLPMCNLYLQDRHAQRTPRWRGVTLIHELKAHGIPVAIASDNVRDPFFGFGNHDGLEVFSMAVRIAHLDTPYSNWVKTIITTPAQQMDIAQNYIEAGAPADLIIFKARYFSELLSRPQGDRLVIRNGIKVDNTLPDYAELD